MGWQYEGGCGRQLYNRRFKAVDETLALGLWFPASDDQPVPSILRRAIVRIVAECNWGVCLYKSFLFL